MKRSSIELEDVSPEILPDNCPSPLETDPVLPDIPKDAFSNASLILAYCTFNSSVSISGIPDMLNSLEFSPEKDVPKRLDNVSVAFSFILSVSCPRKDSMLSVSRVGRLLFMEVIISLKDDSNEDAILELEVSEEILVSDSVTPFSFKPKAELSIFSKLSVDI